MFRRNLIAAALTLSLLPAFAPVAALAGSDDATALPVDLPLMQIDVAGQANGTITIALRPDLAPEHVARVIELATAGAYDNVVGLPVAKVAEELERFEVWPKKRGRGK